MSFHSFFLTFIPAKTQTSNEHIHEKTFENLIKSIVGNTCINDYDSTFRNALHELEFPFNR